MPVTTVNVTPASPPPPPTTTTTATPVTIRRKPPVGAFRGGITGFLLGTTLACGFGWVYFLEEYRNASDLLMESVEELQGSTGKITGYVKRIEEVERRVARLEESVSTKDDLSSLSQEVKQVYVWLSLLLLCYLILTTVCYFRTGCI